MDYFVRKGSSIYCEDLPLKELALQYGTPLYLYSYQTLERHFRVLDQALGGLPHLICYATKANSNLAILRSIANWGGGADVVSGGELFRCLEAGVDPKKIVYSGVGKTLAEIEYALRRKVKLINVESEHELGQVSSVAESMGLTAPISFRLNPNVDPKTHPYISTGLAKNKFGLPEEKSNVALPAGSTRSTCRPCWPGLSYWVPADRSGAICGCDENCIGSN